MSDGYEDMIEYNRKNFDDMVELEVGLYEEQDLLEVKAIDRRRITHRIRFRNILCSPSSLDANRLQGAIAEYFVERMQSNDYFAAEELSFILQASGRYAKLMRLQKASNLFDKLLVFTDEKWQVLPNGVFYQSPLRFSDGHDDLLLGIAKLRAEKLGLVRDKPMMIVANWHYNKRFKLHKVWQPGDIS